MILQAAHTHLYPGHRGKIRGLSQIADLAARHDCVVEFADGSAATALLLADAGDWRLRVDAYRTAAGTGIAAKQWALRVEEDAGGLKFCILGRAKQE